MRTALQPLASIQVLCWSALAPQSLSGLTRLATQLPLQVADHLLGAVHSQRSFIRAAGRHDFGVHFLQSAIVARSPSVAVVAGELNVKGLLPNKPMKQTVRSVTQLAGASCAPERPAAYRQRWADQKR